MEIYRMGINKDCAYAIGFNCGHAQWLLSDGTPWLSCRGVRGIHMGCPESPESKHMAKLIKEVRDGR